MNRDGGEEEEQGGSLGRDRAEEPPHLCLGETRRKTFGPNYLLLERQRIFKDTMQIPPGVKFPISVALLRSVNSSQLALSQ